MFPSIPCSTWKSDVWNVSAFPCLILSKLYKQPLHTWWLGECFWLWTWYVVQSAKLTLGDVSPHLPYLAIFAASCWPKVATSCSSFKPHLGQVYVSLCVTVCVCVCIHCHPPTPDKPPEPNATPHLLLHSWISLAEARVSSIQRCPGKSHLWMPQNWMIELPSSSDPHPYTLCPLCCPSFWHTICKYLCHIYI